MDVLKLTLEPDDIVPVKVIFVLSIEFEKEKFKDLVVESVLIDLYVGAAMT